VGGVAGPTAASAASSHSAHHAKKACKKTKKKAKRCTKKAKKKKKAKATTSTMSAAPTTVRTCTPGSPGAVNGAADPFWQHFESAHLETSPQEQAAAITDIDEYVRLHTVLVEQMLAPSVKYASQAPAAFQELIAAFQAHLESAHLQTSPVEQVQQLVSDPDEYARVHTVLFEQMLAPITAWLARVLSGEAERCTEQTAPSSGAPAPSSGSTASIKDYAYTPNPISVASGTTVTWTNLDSDPHTVTGSGHGSDIKSANLAKGQSYSYTFSHSGTFAYFCAIHPNMKGTVTVS
jgi:plastocyanin